MLRQVTIFRSVPLLLLVTSQAGAADLFSHEYLRRLEGQLTEPLFWFGMFAQCLFFARFIVQWVASERRKRSIIPVTFWYFSLAGGISWFFYGLMRPDLAIMAGAIVSCAIYIRNLMLIYSRAERRRRAGLPVGAIGSTITDEDLPG